ncbi:hypothetical protein [Laspinema olomoucense]|uniref:Lipoprotein n=1 Tax=Laspinema olomoucense D3b TaxID=2953688 RepID=A0ABT2NBB5_9CYAN|nr:MULTISPECIES: hypothetical protein [unclassified Laspinema]MCT7979005.1 hypothetical protein [Laspinema sp. D3b]MCT7991401.1 hypothetical protein [Laspinema sp. D3a]
MSGIHIKAMLRAIALTLLIGLLSGCSINLSITGFQPTREVVQEAIALELSQNKAELRQHLTQHGQSGEPLPKYEVNRVEIWEQDPLKIDGLLAYHVQGTYNLTIQLPEKRVTDRKNNFDLYLQRQAEGKTWRIAKPLGTDEAKHQTWATYLIKPPGYM